MTWNTYADLFEASILDSRPDSSLEVFFGREEDGRIILSQQPAAAAGPSRRHLWDPDGEFMQLEIQESADQGKSWEAVQKLMVKPARNST